MDKAAIETSQRAILKCIKNAREVTSQVKVRSKIKIVTFRLIGYQCGAKNGCEPKLQNASEGMKKIAYKYKPFTK